MNSVAIGQSVGRFFRRFVIPAMKEMEDRLAARIDEKTDSVVTVVHQMREAASDDPFDPAAFDAGVEAAMKE